MRTILELALCALPAMLIACSSADEEPSEPTDETNTVPANPDPTPTEQGGGGTSASPTSAAPAMCETDADCPDGVACVTFTDPATGTEGPGHCDVNETTTSTTDSPTTSAAPAPCGSDADCPAGIACVSFDNGPGFCDVSEMTAN